MWDGTWTYNCRTAVHRKRLTFDRPSFVSCKRLNEPEYISLGDFTANPHAYLRRLRESNQPLVLTIDDEPVAVVNDVATFDRWLDTIDRAEATVGIQEGLASMERGEGVPAREAFEMIRHRVNS